MDNTKIGQYIRLRLKEKGITQEQLAEQLNISSSAVSQVISGKNMFDYPNMILLAKILDEPLDKIINAGEETVTLLEEFSKLSLGEYLKKDLNLNKVQERDSKNKSLIEYVLKNKNYPLLKHLKEKVYLREIENDIRYATLVIENEDIQLFNQVNRNYLSYDIKKFGRVDNDEGYPKKKFIELAQEEQEFIKAVITTKNEALKSNFWFINKLKSRATYRPSIVYYAIEKDAVEFVKFIVETQESFDSELRGVENIKQSRFLDYLKNAVESKSLNCIDYLYSNLKVFSVDKVLENLVSTKDLNFIKTFTQKYTNKTLDRFFYQNQENKYNTYNYFRELVINNEHDLLECLIDFSDQDSLDKLLRDVKEENVELIKLFLIKGARFTFLDSESGRYSPNEQLTALMKAQILKK